MTTANKIDTGRELAKADDVAWVDATRIDFEVFAGLSLLAQRLYVCLRNEEGAIIRKDVGYARDAMLPELDTYLGEVSRACRTLHDRYGVSYEETHRAKVELRESGFISING